VEDLLDVRGREPALASHALEQGEVPALAAPEGEVAPQKQLREPEPLAEEVADEVLRLGQREVPRERDDEQVLDAELLDRLLFLAEGLEAARRAIGAEDRQRVRLEGDRDGGLPGLFRAADDRLEDAAVPEVHPVEVADRGHPVARRLRRAQRVAVDLHPEDQRPAIRGSRAPTTS
jgi:hypothetical protein